MYVSDFTIEIIITINTFLAGFVLTSLNGRHRSENDELTDRESNQIFWEALSFSVLMSNVTLTFFVSIVYPVFSNIPIRINKNVFLKTVIIDTLVGIALICYSIINSVFIYFDNDNDHKISYDGYLSIAVFFAPIVFTLFFLAYIFYSEMFLRTT